MDLSEKAQLLVRELNGLSQSGAAKLSRLYGVIEVMHRRYLAPNPGKRPKLPFGVSKSSTSPGRIGMGNYRLKMKEYLEFWTGHLDLGAFYTLPWTAEEALADYCERKAR